MPPSALDLEHPLTKSVRLDLGFDHHRVRVSLNGSAEPLDFIGKGGREQERLSLARRPAQDVLNLVDEPHIHHTISLIQHHHREVGQSQVALVEVLQDAAGRPHYHVVSVFECHHLVAVRAPAAQGHDSGIGDALGELPQFIRHLVRQLAGGAQDQGLRCEVPGVESVEQRQAKGRGLSAACLGLSNHVTPLQHGRQDFLLDGGHVGVSGLFHPQQKFWA